MCDVRRIQTVVLAVLIGLCGVSRVEGQASQPVGRMIGMYVHQHWPYKHPYAARTWTVEDWRGYAAGLAQLGYNTILVWPTIETMPSALTPSDEAYLRKLSAVIDVLHDEAGMRVYLALCPNVGVDSDEAAKATFEARHFFYCDTRVDPDDPVAMRELIACREARLRPLAKADGVAIIDSDPGGYPGATNESFVRLLCAHRRMLDRLRPGMELIYWMHAGWEAYSRFYATGRFVFGSPAEAEDVLRRLKERDPEPWGLANGYAAARALGLAGRVIGFNYGYIEGEPSFPLTNFGGDGAVSGARSDAPRGVMGNAQTHCVQLPNTLAFARGARGLGVSEADYVAFADALIVGRGRLIVDGWQALAGSDAAAMRAVADKLDAVSTGALETGRLGGLVFGDPGRLLRDLVLQLQMKAACEAFCEAVESDGDARAPFRDFVSAAGAWQRQHGYQNRWYWPRLQRALRTYDPGAFGPLLDTQYRIEGDLPYAHIPGPTPFARIAAGYRAEETFTVRLIEAMERAAGR